MQFSTIFHVPKAGKPFVKDKAGKVIITKDSSKREFRWTFSRDMTITPAARRGFDEKPGVYLDFLPEHDRDKAFSAMAPASLIIYVLASLRQSRFIEGDVLVEFIL